MENNIVEIYKLHVRMANSVSERRGQANHFYMTILSGLLAVVAFSIEQIGNTNFANKTDFITGMVGLLGILLCWIWHINIRSYRQLNSGKFAVLHELEAQLPFAFYKREWEVLGEGQQKKKYLQLSKIETYIPFIIMLPFVLLFIFSMVNFVM